jgi:hypothetical protein
MDITAMLKLRTMNILLSQIAIGLVCKVEKLALNSVIEIWKSMEQLAVVKPGFINMQLM